MQQPGTWQFRLAGWLIGVFAAGFLLSAAITACQALFWLRYGYWPPVTGWSVWIWAGWPPPEFHWLGVEKASLWLLDQPLALILFASSVLLMWLFIGITNR